MHMSNWGGIFKISSPIFRTSWVIQKAWDIFIWECKKPTRNLIIFSGDERKSNFQSDQQKRGKSSISRQAYIAVVYYWSNLSCSSFHLRIFKRVIPWTQVSERPKTNINSIFSWETRDCQCFQSIVRCIASWLFDYYEACPLSFQSWVMFMIIWNGELFLSIRFCLRTVFETSFWSTMRIIDEEYFRVFC